MLNELHHGEGDAKQHQQIALAARELILSIVRSRLSHGDLKCANFILSDNKLMVIDLDAMKSHTSIFRFLNNINIDIKRIKKDTQGFLAFEVTAFLLGESLNYIKYYGFDFQHLPLPSEKKPLISIIIPTYNYGNCLPRAIDSVLSQPLSNYELLIIDDGSTDNTSAIVKSYCDNYPDTFKYYYIENSGASAARNLGIKNSQGDYVFFLDADDQLIGNSLYFISEYISAYPQIDIVFGGHISVHENGQEKIHNIKLLSSDRSRNFSDYLFKKFSIVNGGTTVKRSVYEQIKYNENFRNCEDIPVFAMMIALFNVVSINRPIAYIHKHSDSLRSNFEFIREVGISVAEVIFSNSLLPPELKKYRNKYFASRYVSNFKVNFRNNYYRDAISCYLKAIQHYPLILIRMGLMLKFFICLYKNQKQASLTKQ
ncbi:MAG: glycosyltransferase [Endozoicomonadaceae bacterium]|nr:glycosyltransferase [Endozoicomonadaceae bacterium]